MVRSPQGAIAAKHPSVLFFCMLYHSHHLTVKGTQKSIALTIFSHQEELRRMGHPDSQSLPETFFASPHLP
jgi:hypothetical protein